MSPIPVTSGQQVTVRYNGLLPNNGAGSVYMHAGYGDNQNKWDNISDIKMNPTGEGWEKTFEVKGLSRLDFCFKDDTNNWDSNNGRNWSYEIKSREQSEFLQ
ncbi:MAG: carbohydrate-binding protein [Clostridia bacterium]|nr:carbohydrate-binding protein [Clostridia bacterium]